MPHTHKRDKSKNEASYDLPPTKTAQPLPVKKSTPTTTTRTNQPFKKRKRPTNQDDTPRAFSRLLNPTTYRPPRSGLDDGTTSKKRKTTTTTKTSPPPPSTLTHPKILPHEPLSSFSARVDAAIPFAGVTKNSGKDIPGPREQQTKTEREMQRMQREWREEEKRRKEKMEEENEEGGVVNEEDGVDALLTKRQTKKKGKRKGADMHSGEEEGDIWAGIKAKQLNIINGQGGLVGLHDVVQAPPKLLKAPSKFKDNSSFGKKNGGGMKRKGELSEARRGVVEGYRALMRERREGMG
ncbi:hypothetical protein JMJ35_009928 [Cladonia borealis]|uniref:Uncharacterized protein n=1 Tax=Cladonia borealis TaxID=184061 RepID=A0AA39QU97_9LECA|nr:hypothetical protein JMJ35_009928 [Cladonia borealis]